MKISIRVPILLSILCTIGISAEAFSARCAFSSKCVKSQGTSIPSKQALEMMERCQEFTNGNLGRIAIKSSIQEILQRSGGNITNPLYSAYYAFTELYDSPLKFNRKSKVEETSYEQIQNSCYQLNIDFERYLAN